MQDSKDYSLSHYIGNKIKQFRIERGYTVEELANKLGTSRPTVTRYENGTRKANQDVLFELANIFNKTLDDFFPPKDNAQSATYPTQGDDYSINDDLSSYEIKPKNMVETTTKHIPLIGEIACGDPITAEENVEEYITHVFPKGQVSSGELIDLRAKGHSMEPTIPDGSIVTIRLQPEVEDGEIAAVQVNGDTEATLKRVKHINGLVMLKPDNDAYDPIIITPNNPATIIGKAIQFTSKL